MANLNALESTIQAVQTAYTQLKTGNLSQEELDLLVENSKELYERAVILRYKAYEEKVFGIRENVQEEVLGGFNDATLDSTEMPSKMTGFSVTEEENFNEIEMHSTEIPSKMSDFSDFQASELEEESTQEQPAFDFSLFDDSAEVVKNEELEEEAIEHVSVTATSSDDFGIHEEKVIMEQTTVTPVAEENKGFIAQFSKVDPASFSQIGMSKLDTLIGSFGLNERLQYINELFDGSSEAFAEAIKSLDNLPSYQDALIKASAFANQYNWDSHSETVEEFMTKIKRRHA